LLPHAAVVGAQQPRFEVREDQVDMRQDLRGTLWRALKLSLVLIAAPPQTGVPLPRVRDDRGAFLDHGLDEADELIGRRSANDAQANTPHLPPANLPGTRDPPLPQRPPPARCRLAGRLAREESA